MKNFFNFYSLYINCVPTFDYLSADNDICLHYFSKFLKPSISNLYEICKILDIVPRGTKIPVSGVSAIVEKAWQVLKM